MAEKEYIEREALLDDLDAAMKNSGMGYVVGQTMKRYVKRVSAADVAPVVHGEWIKSSHHTICSVCERKVPYKKIKRGYHLCWKSAFCPHCGARMDGGKHG